MKRPDWWVKDNESDYDCIVASLGYQIVATETFGAYQGDIAYILRKADGRVGTLVVGYGSCSGCDALEAVMPFLCHDHPEACDCDWTGVVQLRDSIAADVRWGEPPEGDDGNWWWSFDKPLYTWLASEYAKAVSA